MKLSLFFISMLLLSTSCKKEETTNPYNHSLTGNWKLVRITGGIGSIDITADKWGHSMNYKFNSNDTYTNTVDGKETNGKYKLVTDTAYGTKSLATYVIMDNNAEGIRYDFTHDTLVMFNDRISDVMYDWYVRD